MSDTKEILKKVDRLIKAHKQGLLGGEKMPEDENPGLDKSSKENLMYFTLPMSLYIKFTDRENITVAPDTHVVQASIKLGVISESESSQSNVKEIVVSRWEELLKGTDLKPIDVHTPMWLWSRGKFSVEI